MRNDVTIYYDCLGADLCDNRNNPFCHLISLGITWTESESAPIADMIKFYHCYNVPEDLPDYIMVR